MNVTIFSVFAVSAVYAPILRHLVDVTAFTDPAPPEAPGLGVPLEFRVFRLLTGCLAILWPPSNIQFLSF